MELKTEYEKYEEKLSAFRGSEYYTNFKKAIEDIMKEYSLKMVGGLMFGFFLQDKKGNRIDEYLRAFFKEDEDVDSAVYMTKVCALMDIRNSMED